MKLAARAAAVGLDPWRVLRPGAHPDEHLITSALVTQLEANEVARVAVQARETAYHVTEGLLEILALFGMIERKRG